MSDNSFDLTLFLYSIRWLEKYIEQGNFFSDWKQRQQTNPNSYIKWKPNARQALANLGTSLQLEFAHNGKGKDRKSPEFREATKTEFYKWINATRIDNNCPKELKLVLGGVYEVIKDREGGYKLFQSAMNAKPEVSSDSPEYQEQLKNVFSSVQESLNNGKAFEEDKSRFSGDAAAGKTTLEEIINSLTSEEKENFHFWPQMTEQEKEDEDKKSKEVGNQVNPTLRNCRTTVIKEITASLKEAKLTNTHLEPDIQNWENEINQSEDVIEIINIQRLVLDDIKKKKKNNSISAQSKTLYTVLTVGATMIILGLIIFLINYYRRKKNAKGK